MTASGTIGTRELSLSIDAMRRVRPGKFNGHIAAGPVEGSVQGGRLTGSYGPEVIDLSLSKTQQLHRLTGVLGEDDIRIEFVRRYNAPFTVRSIGGAGGTVELDLDAVEPMNLVGRVQRVVDALAVIIVAPTVVGLTGRFRVKPVPIVGA